MKKNISTDIPSNHATTVKSQFITTIGSVRFCLEIENKRIRLRCDNKGGGYFGALKKGLTTM